MIGLVIWAWRGKSGKLLLQADAEGHRVTTITFHAGGAGPLQRTAVQWTEITGVNNLPR